MKKLFIALVCAFITGNVLAQGPSCRVANSKDGVVAVLDQITDTANRNGQLYISVSLDNTSTGKYWINVLVDVYDANTGRKVNSQVVKIQGDTKGSINPPGYEPGMPYSFSINRAMCQ